MDTKLGYDLPVVNVTRIRELLNDGADIIVSGFQSNNAMFDDVLKECEPIDEILHIRNWSSTRPGRPVAAKKPDSASNDFKDTKFKYMLYMDAQTIRLRLGYC